MMAEAPDTAALLRDLARAKATFQLRAIEAVICAPPHDQIQIKSCRHCGGEMRPGIAMGQTYTAGAPDFPGDHHGSTMSAGGPGVVIEARKCVDCGHSITFGSLNNDSMVIE
jgi:Zn ribbon nucleic-acid-binding protein